MFIYAAHIPFHNYVLILFCGINTAPLAFTSPQKAKLTLCQALPGLVQLETRSRNEVEETQTYCANKTENTMKPMMFLFIYVFSIELYKVQGIHS